MAGSGKARNHGARTPPGNPAKLPYAGITRIRFEGSVSTGHCRYPRFRRHLTTPRRRGPVARPDACPRPRQHLRGSGGTRSEEHTSELQSLMRISYAVFCLKKKKNIDTIVYPFD